jgi:hypothetical protein
LALVWGTIEPDDRLPEERTMEDSALPALKQLLPIVIPIALLQFGLMVVALVDLIRRKRTKGPKWAWALVILLFNLVGPIIYLVVGREEETEEADDGDSD